MRVNISNEITIFDPPAEFISAVKKSLTIPNPAYEVMKRKGNIRALYGIKKDFRYYEFDGSTLHLGRGCLYRVIKWCTMHRELPELIFRVMDVRMKGKFVSKGLIMRDYQEGVAEEVIKTSANGILNLPTAFGKTIIALKMIEILKRTALIICPRNSIMDQFIWDCKKFYNYDVGQIRADKFDVREITVASIQTLAQRQLEKISEKFSIIFFDECHTAVSDIRMRVLKSFKPKYLYGLSGSPDRSDGQGEAIKFIFGNIIIERELPTTPPAVKVVQCKEEIIGAEYCDMIEAQTGLEHRNRLIASLASSEAKLGRKVLILTKRIAHYNNIHQYLPGNLISHRVTSSLSDKDRGELLKGLRENKTPFDILLGTFSLLSTGVDIPALDTLIIAGDLKSEVLTKQSVGRILRLFEGKKDPLIIDIDDKANGILHRQHLGRKKFYISQGWNVFSLI